MLRVTFKKLEILKAPISGKFQDNFLVNNKQLISIMFFKNSLKFANSKQSAGLLSNVIGR